MIGNQLHLRHVRYVSDDVVDARDAKCGWRQCFSGRQRVADAGVSGQEGERASLHGGTRDEAQDTVRVWVELHLGHLEITAEYRGEVREEGFERLGNLVENTAGEGVAEISV